MAETDDLTAQRARHQPEPCDQLQGCYVCPICRVHSLSLPVCGAAVLGDALAEERQARQAAEARVTWLEERRAVWEARAFKAEHQVEELVRERQQAQAAPGEHAPIALEVQAAEALLRAHQDVLRRVRAALALPEERALPIEVLVAEVVGQRQTAEARAERLAATLDQLTETCYATHGIEEHEYYESWCRVCVAMCEGRQALAEDRHD